MSYGLHVLDTEGRSRICLLLSISLLFILTFKVLVMHHDANIKTFMYIDWYGLEAPYSSDYSCLCVAEVKKNKWKWMRVQLALQYISISKGKHSSVFFFFSWMNLTEMMTAVRQTSSLNSITSHRWTLSDHMPCCHHAVFQLQLNL